MTVLPKLEQQLIAAARAAGAQPLRRRTRHRPLKFALAVAVIAAFGLGFVRLNGQSPEPSAVAQALNRVAARVEHGLAAPRLSRGTAWYVEEIQATGAPWGLWSQPEGTGTTGAFHAPLPIPAPAAAVPFSAFRGFVVNQERVSTWLTHDGKQRGTMRQIGHGTFYGSPAVRARWLAHGRAGGAVRGVTLQLSSGFGVGTRRLTYRQVLALPRTASGVFRFLRAVEPARAPSLADMSTLLAGLPLRPAARAAVFRATEQLPHLRYVGKARDPLGRVGVAIEGGGEAALEPGFPRTRLELIFDPQTAALLAQETLLIAPAPSMRLPAGFPASWTAYVSSKVVPSRTIPKFRTPNITRALRVMRSSSGAAQRGAGHRHGTLINPPKPRGRR